MSVFKPLLMMAVISASYPVFTYAQSSDDHAKISKETSKQHVSQKDEKKADDNEIEVIDVIKRDTTSQSAFEDRLEGDKEALDNVFAITQYRQNYVLPITYVGNPNTQGNEDLTPENVDNKEAKFQISVKLPLYLEDTGFDGMYFGFTLTSFWQLYNSEVSKPFRETNYEPEIFWQETGDYSILGYKFNLLQVGFNHMSNGQSGLRSRSWNRLFASILFSDDDNIYYAKTWYRIPEDNKEDPLDPSGDDNPDIQDYYGRVELGYGREFGDFKLLTLLRNNLDFNDNRGSIQVDLSYSISDRYEILLQYFNGYGDSLIDYNNSQHRIGLGFQLLFL